MRRLAISSIFLALLASVAYGLGVAFQQRAATRAGSSSALLGSLFRAPVWWVGTLLNAMGYGLQAAALRHGSLPEVQSILVLSVVVSLPSTAYLHGRRLGWRDWLAVLQVSAALACLLHLMRAAPHSAGLHLPLRVPVRASLARLLPEVLTLPVIWLVARQARRRAWPALLSLCAGAGFGVAAACIKIAVTAPEEQRILALSALMTASGSTWLAFGWLQHAFALGSLGVAYPLAMLADPVTAALLGAVALQERLQPTPIALLGMLLAACVQLAGVRALLTSPRLVIPQAGDVESSMKLLA